MTLRVGSLIYPTWSGLGVLARSFHRAGIVTDPFVVEHAHFENHHREWYPGAPSVPIREIGRRMSEIRRWMEGLDVFLAFETPFAWELFAWARGRKIKTVLMPMYECTPQRLPAEPDLFLCPSRLDLDCFPAERSVFIPVPVEGAPWRRRERAEIFVMNAGHGGMKGRNGTAELLAALEHIRTTPTVIIRSQKSLGSEFEDKVACLSKRLDIHLHQGTMRYEDLWTEGDVLVFPERWNGLSLPLQEARAAGMLVMCGDRYPMNTWLPREPLIPVEGYRRSQIGPAYRGFDEALFEPRTIAATIDAWFGRDISAYSESGRAWAEEMSWEKIKPLYLKALAP